jgi:hypothetical protein
MERPAQFLDRDFDKIWDIVLRAARNRGLSYIVFDRAKTIYDREDFKTVISV